MKKSTWAAIGGMMALTVLTACAQDKGRFEVYPFEGFKLHVYYTNDVMADASYIVEGQDGLVTMEHPLFKENAAEFDRYIKRLGKPVEQVVTDYHEGSSGQHPQAVPEGMPAFMKGGDLRRHDGGLPAGFRRCHGRTAHRRIHGGTVRLHAELGGRPV